MMSSCCEAICDEGPRFLIANIILGIIQTCFFFTSIFIEQQPWGIWFGLFWIAAALLNFSVVKSQWRITRKCGDLFGLFTCLHFGHFWSAMFATSYVYTGGWYSITAFSAVAFFFTALAMIWLSWWHKKIICPRDPEDPSHIDNQSNPHKFKIFKYSLGPMAAFVYGMAESRFGSGMVPAPHSSESLIGMCTAGLMFAMYFRKFRNSGWANLTCVIWSIVVLIMLILSFVLYAVQPNGVESPENTGHDTDYAVTMAYGISIIVCIVYSSFFLTAFGFKFCLLGESLHFNFSSTPIEVSKTTVITSSSMRNPVDIEIQPYGMSRAEAEATARKLGFGTDASNITRDPTDASVSSVQEP